MRRLLLFCFIACSAGAVIAQGELPVEMYTGRPVIFVPLAGISSHEISDQIGLSYDATGIRVNQPSGNFGLGWNLQAGGTIRRQLRGLPDDWTGPFGDARRGWCVKNTSNVTVSYEIGTNFNNAADTIASPPDSNESGVYTKLNGYNFTMDTEPDIFSYSCGSHSGQFVFSNAIFNNADPPVAHTLQFDDIKIAVTQADDKSITSFTITTDDGTVYTFDQKVTEKRATKAIAPSVQFLKRSFALYDTATYNAPATYTSEWGLSSIRSPLGAIINYGYVLEPSDTKDTVRVSIRKNDGSGFLVKDIYSEHVTGGRWLLTSVTGSTGSAAYLMYDDNGLLSKVSLIDTRRTSPFIKSIILSYQSPDIADPKRFYLNTIQDSSSCSCVPPYRFTYIDGGDTGAVLPGMNSKMIDYWGYFNGRNNVTLAPTVYYYPSQPHPDQIRLDIIQGQSPADTANGADRRPDPILVKTGTLSSIQYPAGGSTTLTYEVNQYYDARNGLAATNGGGLRVKTITYYDGVSSSSVIRKTFSYLDSSGHSSGRLLTRPLFAIPTFRYVDPQTGSPVTKTGWSYLLVRTENDISQQETTNDSPIGYTEVRVYRTGSGWARYQYLIPGLYGDWKSTTNKWIPTRNKFARASTSAGLGPITSGGSWMFANGPNPNFAHERGLTWRKREYPEGDTTHAVRWTQTTYQYRYALDSMPVYGVSYEYYPNCTTNTFFYAKYRLFAGVAKTIQTEKVIVFDPADPAKFQTTTSGFTYGSSSHRLLTRMDQTAADGTIYSTNMKYPLDYGTVPTGSDTTSQMIKLLQTNFRNGTPVEQWTTRKVGATESLTSAAVLWFNDFGTGNKVLTKKTYAQSLFKPIAGFTPAYINATTKKFTIDPTYRISKTWLYYDGYGNPQTIVGTDKIPHTTFWGSSYSLPAFSIRNAYTNLFGFSNFEETLGQEFSVTGNTYTGAGHTGNFSFYPGSKLTKFVTKANVSSYVLSFWVNATSALNFTITLRNGSGTTVTAFSGVSVPVSGGSSFAYFSKIIDVTGVTTSTMYIDVQGASLPATPSGGSSSSLRPVIDDIAFYPFGADLSSTTYTIPFGVDAVTAGNQTVYTTYDASGRQKFILDTDKNIRQKKSYHFASDSLCGTALSAHFSFPSPGVDQVSFLDAVYDGLTMFTADGNCVEAVYYWKLNHGSYTIGTSRQWYTFTTPATDTLTLKVKHGTDSAVYSAIFRVVLPNCDVFSCLSGATSVDCNTIRSGSASCVGVTDPGGAFTTFKITGVSVAETITSYQWMYAADGATMWTNVATTQSYTKKFLPGMTSYAVMCMITTNTGRIGYTPVTTVTRNCSP